MSHVTTDIKNIPMVLRVNVHLSPEEALELAQVLGKCRGICNELWSKLREIPQLQYETSENPFTGAIYLREE